MKPRWIVLISLVLLGLLSYYYHLDDQRREASTSYGGFAEWPPNAGAIRQKLAPLEGTADPNKVTPRHKQYALLFEGRFRKHDPPLAIGMKFLDGKLIKLMCPARMEPWIIDTVALSAWRESGAAFGHSYDIDIYETFIGMPPVQIGRLRPQANDPRAAVIRYAYPAVNQAPLPGGAGTGP